MTQKRRDPVSDTMKNLILLAAVVLTVGSCLMAIGSNESARKIQQGLDLERYNRMEVEEKLEKAAGKIASLEGELQKTTEKIVSIQAVMQQGQSTNSNLQEQLEAIAQLKQSLEQKLDQVQKAQAAQTAVVSLPAVGATVAPLPAQ